MDGIGLAMGEKQDFEVVPSPRDLVDLDGVETTNWYGIGAPSAQRRQGWKLYVSATPANYVRLLRSVAPLLVRHGIPFKYLRSIDHLCSANLGLYGFSQVGKNLVAYIEEPTAASEAIAELRRWLDTSGHVGPRVPRVRQLWNEKSVFVRYGAYRGTTLSISGRELADDRDDPNAVCELLAQDETWNTLARADDDPRRSDKQSLLVRYPVHSAICRSGKGGVFEATDDRSGDKCIVKLGLKCGATLPDGRDGAHFVSQEAEMYALMNARGMGEHLPCVIDFACEADASILILEKLAGPDLHAARSSLSSEPSWVDKAIEIVSKAHLAGFVLGDVKLSNFVVQGASLRLIDLESCQDIRSNRAKHVPVSFSVVGGGDFDPINADSIHFLLSVLFVEGIKESLRASRMVDLNELLARPPMRDAWDERALELLRRLMGSVGSGCIKSGGPAQ